MQLGNVCRLGRSVLKVKALHEDLAPNPLLNAFFNPVASDQSTDPSSSATSSPRSVSPEVEVEAEVKVEVEHDKQKQKQKHMSSTGDCCRYCASDVHSVDNPLLSICRCSGSARAIHLNCVKAWLKYQLQMHKGTEWSSYHWRSFQCEICQTKYPCRFPSPSVL
jgi:hypothetical protein